MGFETEDSVSVYSAEPRIAFVLRNPSPWLLISIEDHECVDGWRAHEDNPDCRVSADLGGRA
jgi:hypothetical protein